MDAAKALAMAVKKEAEEYALYTGVAQRTEDTAAQTLLTELAEEEARHKDMLEELSAGSAASFVPRQAQSLKIAEYLAPKRLRPDSSLQEVLVHAMKREQEATAFYRMMADAVGDAGLRELLKKLSVMEDSHKARLEILYENTFMREM